MPVEVHCTSFGEFIRSKTGLSAKKANNLVRVARALEFLPLMDEAFSRGELFWTAVRAMATVATPQTEAQWIEYAKRHRVEEVERRVVSAKPGEDPEDQRWGRSPVRYPYRFIVNAEVHQAYEALASILSLKKGEEVSIARSAIDTGFQLRTVPWRSPPSGPRSYWRGRKCWSWGTGRGKKEFVQMEKVVPYGTNRRQKSFQILNLVKTTVKAIIPQIMDPHCGLKLKLKFVVRTLFLSVVS